jgi:acetyl esterase/lipase
VFNQEHGNQASPEIIIAADSSGASLALALMINLKEHIRKNIKCLALFSPWVDLSPESAVYKSKKNDDPVISNSGYRRSADLYTYTSNLKNPLVSPVYAPEESFRDFPPLFIQMGGKEALLADVERFCNKLKNASVPYILDVWEDMMHMFQMADEYLAESHLAIERVGKYIKK